jgi:hypothetical protein
MSSSIWGSESDIYYSLTVTVLFFWGDLSDERTGLSFAYAAGPRQRCRVAVRIVQCCEHPLHLTEVLSLYSLRTVKVKVMLRPTVPSASPS